MTLPAGSRLGPYEILAPLGAGGMGEVYRAKDPRLDRTVAIKVLAAHRSSSPEVRQRFEREAKTISQLSHPHICAIYDVGHQDGTDYLVMELLEGQTLADRLARGPLPLDQALRFGTEIADALDVAHRQGIVHRDLKPGNLMLTSSGVKILDFGLAKAFGPPPDASALTALPTEAPLTEQGTLLGTVQYMAPEQLEGKEADGRTDIFALGLVLYESVTGQKAFHGATRASLIGAVLRDEPPPVSRVTPVAPRALDRVVSTCLAKEPEDRWQTARDVALQLDGIRRDQSSAEPGPVAPVRRGRSSVVPWLLAAAASIAAIAVLLWPRPKPAPFAMKSFLLPPPNTTFNVYGANVAGVAVAPNGQRLAFGTRETDGTSRLWIRELNTLEPYPLPGGEGALFPFWSPDSRSLGFFAKGRLKVVEASPSPPAPRELADVLEPRGGSWSEDGTILYASQNFVPLMRVPAAGGTPRPATQLDRTSGESAHRWPHFLPGGKRFLYEIRRVGPGGQSLQGGPLAIFLGSLDGKEKRLVLSEDTSAAYSPPGYLLFRRANNLMAIACDPDSLALRGEPIVMARDIEGRAGTGASIFGVSRNLLVYSPIVGATPAQMVWLDRSGKRLSAIGPPDRYVYLGVAPDGRSVVTARIEDPLPPELWLFDTAVGRGIRLTRDRLAQVAPLLSSDGKRIFFSSNFKGPWDLWEMSASGGDAKPLLESATTKTANDVSADGRWLMFREFNAGTRGDLKVISLSGDRQVRTYIATTDDETNGTFSPDGTWVAYTSDETGRKEVYAAPFPDPTRRLRVSTEGGSQPRWSRDGKELFYVRSGQLLAVPIGRQADSLSFGESRPLFALPTLAMNDPGFDQFTRYNVSSDGRFLALVREDSKASVPLVLEFNWQEGLK
jgi:serine/threonine protein kinase/Tol biopolymer transport system component